MRVPFTCITGLLLWADSDRSAPSISMYLTCCLNANRTRLQTAEVCATRPASRAESRTRCYPPYARWLR
eukprot:6554841-Alexandrium_andersonii.AAC.1